MKCEINKDGFAVIVLPGRVESQNYLEVEKELWELSERHAGRKLVLDATETTYVSSAGLRVFLGLQKKGRLEYIDNVSQDVYNIFNITGMLDIFKVYLDEEKFEVDKKDLVGEDIYGYLHALDEEKIARTYKMPYTVDEIEAGAALSRVVMKYDVPNALVYGKIQIGERIGYSYAVQNYETVATRIRKVPSERIKVMQMLCDELARFHACDELKEKLPKAVQRYQEMIHASKDFSDKEKEVLSQMVSMMSRNNQVIFESVCGQTVLYENSGLVFVDMMHLRYGNLFFELAGMALELTEDDRFLGVGGKEAESTFVDFLKLYLKTEDTAVLEDYKKASMAFALLLSVLLGTRKAKKKEAALEQIHQMFLLESAQMQELLTRVKAFQKGATDEDAGLHIDIRQRTVTQFFKKKTLLKDIHMEIRPGELVMLLGGSGAGKTTFFNAVTGYEKADATILLGKKNLYKEYEHLKHKIAFAPQQDLLRDEDTVYNTLKNAADMRLPVTMSKEEKEAEIARMLEIFGLSNQRNTLIRTLSGGQRKRASIAVEFIANPDIFFLDEPDSGLDAVMARSLMEDLRKLTGTEKMIVVISHSPDRVIDLFDKVIILAKSEVDHAGHLAFFGSPQEAREFFECDTMEQVLRVVNLKAEGGQGRADECIEKYARWR